MAIYLSDALTRLDACPRAVEWVRSRRDLETGLAGTYEACPSRWLVWLAQRVLKRELRRTIATTIVYTALADVSDTQLKQDVIRMLTSANPDTPFNNQFNSEAPGILLWSAYYATQCKLDLAFLDAIRIRPVLWQEASYIVRGYVTWQQMAQAVESSLETVSDEWISPL